MKILLVVIVLIITLLIGCKKITDPEPEIVYINPPELNDPHFHKNNGLCRGYSVNYSIAIPRNEAEKLGYIPCPRCFGE